MTCFVNVLKETKKRALIEREERKDKKVMNHVAQKSLIPHSSLRLVQAKVARGNPFTSVQVVPVFILSLVLLDAVVRRRRLVAAGLLRVETVPVRAPLVVLQEEGGERPTEGENGSERGKSRRGTRQTERSKGEEDGGSRRGLLQFWLGGRKNFRRRS